MIPAGRVPAPFDPGAPCLRHRGKSPRPDVFFSHWTQEPLRLSLRYLSLFPWRIMEKTYNLASLFAIGWSILLLVLAVALNG